MYLQLSDICIFIFQKSLVHTFNVDDANLDDIEIVHHKPYWWSDAKQAKDEGWLDMLRSRPTGRTGLSLVSDAITTPNWSCCILIT